MLPTSQMVWPPEAFAPVWPVLREWSAWWEGSSAALLAAYRTPPGVSVRPSQYAGGVVGTISRAFWGRPPSFGQQHRGLHIPLATDLCQASADLLLGEPLTVTAEQEAAQPFLDDVLEQEADLLLGAAEACAALGGVYLRVTWDQSVSPKPFLTRVDADAAVPEFVWGRLRAVTFWRVLPRTDGDPQTRVVRHLERHSLDARGYGVVEHSVWEGTGERLGNIVPLTDHPSTAALADLLGPEGLVSTESPGLAVVYVPNQTPQRRWRSHDQAQYLGRSDLDGVEPLLDALDEVWTSWMRDLRLAKARLIVPQTMLDDNGPGRGASFDLDREVYEGVNAPPSSISSGQSAGVVAQQFKIRTAEHAATAEGLIKQIVRTAGYSASTFSEDGDGQAITATEVTARAARTMRTRDRKIAAWKRGLTSVLQKLLAVDAALFGGTASEVTVTFPDAVSEPLLSLAQTAAALRAAKVASIKTAVQIVHPDWDEQQIETEVALIQAETVASSAAPQAPEQASGNPDNAQEATA